MRTRYRAPAWYGTDVRAANSEPLRESITPSGLKRTVAARSVYSFAGPKDRPVMLLIRVCPGIMVNVTLNEPSWLANAVLCQRLRLTTHATVGDDVGGAVGERCETRLVSSAPSRARGLVGLN